MTYAAIRAQGVGKTFGARHLVAPSARHALEQRVRAPFGSGPAARGDAGAAFWALRDVSFEVAPGEIVGIVGRNGAGKSVLLKLLSRVTRPSRGRIELRGAVAPMLEVGTGFHPDLTGLENIYLNGAILGMPRGEVRRRIDEIVGFAEIGPFLDAPIKRCSSGMKMRLAFAVAAHLDRDIFLLDEVLTVGDSGFQERCRARLRRLADEGKTVILVSHGDYRMERFCSRALLLDRGELVAEGAPAEVYARYRALRDRAGEPA